MFDIILLSIGLAMDAFAVSVTCGIANVKSSVDGKNMLFKASAIFGLFQGGMIALGMFLGNSFKWLIESFDHWIAFALLLFIGIKMIKEAFEPKVCDIKAMSMKRLLLLGVATSIDALAAGIGFSASNENVVITIAAVGIITWFLSRIGSYLGQKMVSGNKLAKYMEIFGGVILVFIGVKMLVEHIW